MPRRRQVEVGRPSIASSSRWLARRAERSPESSVPVAWEARLTAVLIRVTMVATPVAASSPRAVARARTTPVRAEQVEARGALSRLRATVAPARSGLPNHLLITVVRPVVLEHRLADQAVVLVDRRRAIRTVPPAGHRPHRRVAGALVPQVFMALAA